MNIFPGIIKEFKKLLIATVIAAVIVVGLATLAGLYVATQIFIGVLMATMILQFYMVIAWIIIVKKNIAWAGVVIVIKYSILIASIYYVWKLHDVFLVTMGLVAQLIALAMVLAAHKAIELKRIR